MVVVNCGGRTRSIIGAQSLINAGVPNKVVSMKNGTQAWHLAGFEVRKGSTASAPQVSAGGRAAAKAAADRVAERFGITRIDADTLARWQAESATRTTYVFDVRSPDEYAAGHVPGMKHVAGGQLIQETDRHAATWGARVVLVDDEGVRSVMTAHWMKQMGWEVAAMTVDMKSAGRESGPWKPRVQGLDEAKVATIDAATLRQRMKSDGISVVDVDWSRDYLNGHIPAAWYGIRARLAAILPQLPPADTVVFTSGDGVLARLAAADAAKATSAPVLALDGGTAAWRAAGYPLEQGATRMASAADDIRLKAREQSENMEEAMKAYLSWEIDLADQMAKDDDQRFRVLKA
jgi:rhodanese-related sulfurtransferase